MSSSAGSRVPAPPSLANAVQHISRHHSPEEPHLSSSESFSTLSDDSSEDDEVVYSISDLSVVSAPHSYPGESSSEDDYVLLNRRADSPYGVKSPPSGPSSLSASVIQSQVGASSEEGLSDAFSHLQVEDSDTDSVRPTSQATTRRTKRGRSSRPAKTTPAQSPSTGLSKPTVATPKKASTASPQTTPAKAAPKKTRKRSRSSKAAPQSAQVPKKAAHLSEEGKAGSDSQSVPVSAIVSASFYQEAVQYISTFLATPSEKPKAQSDLTFLKALIIELGLCTATASDGSENQQSFVNLPSLPTSLRAAKALLKSRVFVNVRDYLDVRNEGLAALQGIMHPTRQALVKDLTRGKGKRKVPRGLVKDSGLGVLLVTCYH